MLIDTHAHLTDDKFSDDLEDVLKRAEDSGVGVIVDVADSLDSSLRCIEHADRYSAVFATVGVHPNNAGRATEADVERVVELASSSKVVAIGESGLDYYRDWAPKELQEKLLRRFLRLAIERRLPLILHCRNAYGELIEILREVSGEDLAVVAHCFSGSRGDAEALVELGHFISVGGPLTFPQNTVLRETVKNLPMDRILIETDCPYLSPQEKRGKRNEPANLVFIAEGLARLRGFSREEVARATTINAKRLFSRI